jgi:DNA-binding transcriptional MerR regulator
MSDDQKRKIKRLRNQFFTVKEIAAMMNLPRGSVDYVLYRRRIQCWKREDYVRRQAELIRTLRHTVKHLQAKLEEKQVQA